MRTFLFGSVTALVLVALSIFAMDALQISVTETTGPQSRVHLEQG